MKSEIFIRLITMDFLILKHYTGSCFKCVFVYYTGQLLLYQKAEGDKVTQFGDVTCMSANLRTVEKFSVCVVRCFKWCCGKECGSLVKGELQSERLTTCSA